MITKLGFFRLVSSTQVRVVGLPQCGMFMDQPDYLGQPMYTPLYAGIFEMMGELNCTCWEVASGHSVRWVRVCWLPRRDLVIPSSLFKKVDWGKQEQKPSGEFSVRGLWTRWVTLHME